MIKPSPSPSVMLPETKDQQEALDSIKNCARGRFEGIQSPYLRKNDLNNLKELARKSSKKASKSMVMTDISLAMYTEAAYRDAKYAIAGRKFLRCAGLNGRTSASLGRTSMMAPATNQ